MKIIIELDDETLRMIKEDCYISSDIDDLLYAVKNGEIIDNKPCDNCQEFDCYGCKYKEDK